MLSRHNISRFVAAFLPVFVLIGCFLIVKVSTHIEAQAELCENWNTEDQNAYADRDGDGFSDGRETPGVPSYCPGVNVVDYTSEYAYFFADWLRENWVQKWYRSQDWSFGDGTACNTSAVRNPTWDELADDGFWSGWETKSRAWNEAVEGWVIQVFSDTMRYDLATQTLVDADGEEIGTIDILCPTKRLVQEGHLLCPSADVNSLPDWDGTWDEGIDWDEYLFHGDDQADDWRRGKLSKVNFPCYPYPSNF